MRKCSKTIAIVCIVLLSGVAALSAQEEGETSFFDNLIFELGGGIGALPGFEESTGIVAPLSLSYFLATPQIGSMTSYISAGVRWEPGLILGGSSSSAALLFFSAITATGDFYLKLIPDLDLVPFAGIALGMYSVAGLGMGTTDMTSVEGSYFGVAPRIGVRMGGLNGYISYHIVAAPAGQMNPSFFSLVAGYTFGGRVMQD